MSSRVTPELDATTPMRRSWVLPAYEVNVSAVIVNYNGRDLLKRTLETLGASGVTSTLEVIVVDNGSTDGSNEMVRSEFPSVRCIANESNLGLTRSNNQGMVAARGRYLYLPDNDIIVMPDTVDALARYLDDHPEAGAVGSKVLNVDGTLQGTMKSLPTPMSALFGRNSVLTRLFPRNRFSRRYLAYAEADLSQPFRIGSVARCSMMVRREAIERAGPMDERYFVYWSDVDWCRAISEAGFEVHCVPASVVIHDEHQGAKSGRRRRSRRAISDFHRGAYHYYRKWHVRRPWHPNHIVAVVGLTLRGSVVLVTEQVRWGMQQIRGAVGR